MARDKLDKLMRPEAMGDSPAMRKAASTITEIRELLADQRKLCDDLRKQMEEIERQDLRQMVQQRFFQNAPINGTYHGLEAFNKLMKGD